MASMILKNLPYKTEVEKKITDEQIIWLRNSLDSKHRISKIRGRGPRKKWALKNGLHPRAYDQDLPLEYAERITIYVDLKGKHKDIEWLNRRKHGLQIAKWSLESEIREINYSLMIKE